MRRAERKKKKRGSRRREKGKLNLRDFLNRPDIVENETEKFLISIPKAESSEPDEAAWRDSALKLNAERLRTEKRLRDSERTLQETAWDPKEYTESGFPILSCMSTATRKKIDQLPKANEMVASLIPSIDLCYVNFVIFEIKVYEFCSDPIDAAEVHGEGLYQFDENIQQQEGEYYYQQQEEQNTPKESYYDNPTSSYQQQQEEEQYYYQEEEY